MPEIFSAEDKVRHVRFGIGTVLVGSAATVVVRFAHGIEECAASDLEGVRGIEKRLADEAWDIPLEVINRVQAEAIRSVNDTWGAFSRSRIELLPHQLWVCRQVSGRWPARWLIADDVGLGKTVEAGMILMSLLSRSQIRRLLILCPASLVEQWQARLREMFDIRLSIYTSEADRPKTDFWGTHDRVIASLQTLRTDQNGRHTRILNSDPWDLLIVDEAHHLNADEQTGYTLGHRLVRRMVDEGKVVSMLFFTGTPHRGKEFGFFALLNLLRPDLFNPRLSASEQLPALPQVMIRNNKSAVTDLKGDRLFFKTVVTAETYSYSEEERHFYELLTRFITTGRAYASGLSDAEGRTVMLVLIAMQKLASSSVAAIHRALRRRLERIQKGQESLRELQDRISSYQEAEQGAQGDEIARLEEEIAELSSAIRLMADEEPFLKELLAAAEQVAEETKVNKILRLLETSFAGRPVLLFTEYKATQSMIMSALIKRFGDGCVTFINGDSRAEGIIGTDGAGRTLVVSRETAAQHFNSGKARFLVSTEAGGEGIDLQENCHSLIHVDLPWNPMRLHQRVGRLNRYGQTRQVEVITLHNPQTVESRIWKKLNDKLDLISFALRQVMDEPEDLLNLVLGMTSPSLFRELFADGPAVPRDTLEQWFDQKTARFGGQDVISTVKNLVGNVSRFEFQQVSDVLPRVDLPDLFPFFETALTLNNRKLRQVDDGFSFLTPDEWKADPGVMAEYHNMLFDRRARAPKTTKSLLGVGHRVIDRALAQACGREAALAAIPSEIFNRALIVFRISDRVTTDDNTKRLLVAGIIMSEDSSAGEVVLDWQVIKLINKWPLRKTALGRPSVRPVEPDALHNTVKRAEEVLQDHVARLNVDIRYPLAEPLAIFWPA